MLHGAGVNPGIPDSFDSVWTRGLKEMISEAKTARKVLTDVLMVSMMLNKSSWE